jgi:hypothetical protein
MTSEELQDLCALYVLDLLDPQEMVEIDARIRTGDGEVLRSILAYREVLGLLPHALPLHQPAPAVRERLMAGLHTTIHEPQGQQEPTGRPKKGGWLRSPWLWVPAAAVLVLVQGWLITSSLRHVHDVAGTSNTLLARAREHEWFLNDFKILALTGTEHAPKAGAMVFWDTQRNVCTFLVHDLPPLSPSERYQLWFRVGGANIRSESFWPAVSGPTMLQASLPSGKAGIESALVTRESSGDVLQPTGKTILQGQF